MWHMTRDEWWAFASEGTRTGKLGVVTPSGAPHVTPVWFVLTESTQGDGIVFTTGADTVKARALRREPRLSLTVDDQRPPYSFVQFTAEATSLSDDLTAMAEWARRIGARYMGEDQAEDVGRRNAVPGELLVHARITKVIALAVIAN